MVRELGPRSRADDAITRADLEAVAGTPPTRISVGTTNQITSGYTGVWFQTDSNGAVIGLMVETAGQDGPVGSRVSVGQTNSLPSGTKGLWVQTDSSGNVVTLWVETAGT